MPAGKVLKKILIRADATPVMGSGHVMRCLPIAQAAKNAGWEPYFVTFTSIQWVRKRLLNSGIRIRFHSEEDAKYNSGKMEIDCLFDWMIIDGYHFDTDYQKKAYDIAKQVLVIDDYGHLPAYKCDILLNQNPDAENITYSGTIGAKLFGSRFAILRSEFKQVRKGLKKYNAYSPNILVSMGGGDYSSFLPDIARNFRKIDMRNTTLSIIAGAVDSTLIENTFKDLPCKLVILKNVKNMASLLWNTDICISAGGCTCWELCYLGIPFLTYCMAENQKALCEWLYAQNLAMKFTSANLEKLMTNVGYRKAISERLQGEIDGNGIERILKAMNIFTSADIGKKW